MSVGVYRLEHLPSGRFYIGCSFKLEERRRMWFRTLACVEQTGFCYFYAKRFSRFALGTKAAHWRWLVLERFQPTASRLVVRAAEGLAIQDAMDFAGDRCLNSDRGYQANWACRFVVNRSLLGADGL